MIGKMMGVAALCALAGCGRAPGAGGRTQPLGIISSAPPGDMSATHLRCLPGTDEGPGVTCTRHD